MVAQQPKMRWRSCAAWPAGGLMNISPRDSIEWVCPRAKAKPGRHTALLLFAACAESTPTDPRKKTANGSPWPRRQSHWVSQATRYDVLSKSVSSQRCRLFLARRIKPAPLIWRRSRSKLRWPEKTARVALSTTARFQCLQTLEEGVHNAHASPAQALVLILIRLGRWTGSIVSVWPRSATTLVITAAGFTDCNCRPAHLHKLRKSSKPARQYTTGTQCLPGSRCDRARASR